MECAFARLREIVDNAEDDQLVGRILKGRQDSDFVRLSPDNRRLVLLTDTAGLRKIVALPLRAALLSIGYEEAYIEGMLRRGYRFQIVVCRAGGAVRRATWPAVIDVAAAEHPNVAARIRAHARHLEERSFAEWLAAAPEFPWDAVRDVGRTHAAFMSLERYAALEDPQPWQTRAFFFCELRLTGLFSGDGCTCDADGTRGVGEWLVRNVDIHALDGALLVPFPADGE